DPHRNQRDAKADDRPGQLKRASHPQPGLFLRYNRKSDLAWPILRSFSQIFPHVIEGVLRLIEPREQLTAAITIPYMPVDAQEFLGVENPLVIPNYLGCG